MYIRPMKKEFLGRVVCSICLCFAWGLTSRSKRPSPLPAISCLELCCRVQAQAIFEEEVFCSLVDIDISIEIIEHICGQFAARDYRYSNELFDGIRFCGINEEHSGDEMCEVHEFFVG